MQLGETIILDGKATAAAVRADVRAATQRLIEGGGRPPGLAVVLVGDDPASQVYVRSKDRDATEAGFQARTIRLAADTPQGELLALIDELGEDAGVHGILVQLPLPAGFDATEVIERIPAHKDVDGLTSASVAALVMGRPGHRPCTPSGCLELLDRAGIGIEGRHMVIVGRSALVGKPLVQLALERNATVTICHSRTRNLADHCRRADVLVAAVGVPHLIQGDWIQPGAVVLDVGINRGEDGKLIGDVDFEAARGVAGWITPVPGGIGPMTRAMLLVNTLAAAAQAAGRSLEELGFQD